MSVGANPFYKDLDRGDGCCLYFDDKSKLCKIYNDRPIKCNIDKFYELYFSTIINKEDFYKLNIKSCKILKINKNII